MPSAKGRPFSDFGGYPSSQPESSLRVRGLDDLRSIVLECVAQGKRMRTRCFGHSMNGMSVPSPDETLLDMSGLRTVRWRGAGVIGAGAGVSVWELDQYVRQFGWKLPVVNDGGGEASSVGGFAAAGGIGQGAMFYGGFWESVSEISMIAGNGSLLSLDRDDPRFRWVFGSMGTLGAMYEIAIQLVPLSQRRPKRVADVAELPPAPAKRWPPHLWLTWLVPEGQQLEASTQLTELMARHSEAWHARGLYEYYLAHRRLNPPLLLSGDDSHVAIGVWGDRLAGDSSLAGYFALEQEFQALTVACGFRRYFQTELIWKPRNLEQYVGRRCAEEFGALKDQLNPRDLLNSFTRHASAGLADARP